MNELSEQDFVKKIYQARPSLVLNIDNEFMTLNMMDQLQSFYKNTGSDIPSRHYFTRFGKDMQQWATKYLDYIHFTTNLTQVA